MRHNKIVGWDMFIDLVEKVQKVSPWLSRQIAKRAADWPFWFSGVQAKSWDDRLVHVHLPLSVRNAIEGEVSQGHLLLGAELTLRLMLLRFRHEFPFRYRFKGSRVDIHHTVDQSVDYRFQVDKEEWERIRLTLARESVCKSEFVFRATLADGRAAATFTFPVAFQLEKFLSA